MIRQFYLNHLNSVDNLFNIDRTPVAATEIGISVRGATETHARLFVVC